MVTSEIPNCQDFSIEGVRHITPENPYAASKNGDSIVVPHLG